jgi:2-methylisocitrate lyase-like PEP mutase family enzyme
MTLAGAFVLIQCGTVISNIFALPDSDGLEIATVIKIIGDIFVTVGRSAKCDFDSCFGERCFNI